jgi:hypothetical protein
VRAAWVAVFAALAQAQEPVQPVHELETVASPWLAEFSAPQFEARDLKGVAAVKGVHGELEFSYSHERLNARNPFNAQRPPYRFGRNENKVALSPFRWWNLELQSTLDGRRRISVVNALGLDREFNRVPIRELVRTPSRSLVLEPSMEFRVTQAHRFLCRYIYDRWAADRAGAGGLTLASRALDERNLLRSGNLDWYWEPGGRWVAAVRTRMVRDRYSRRPSPDEFSVDVQGAFLGGDPQLENEAHSHASESADAFVSILERDHELKIGAEARGLRVENLSRKNFNATLLFAGGSAPVLNDELEVVGRALTVIDSLERLRRTALLERKGLPDAEILARGGGASLFTGAIGDPFARLRQWEYGAYVQDVWQVRPWLLLSVGLRLQTQTGVGNDTALGPRFGLAWGLSRGGSAPRQVIRLGAGVFHDRFSDDLRMNLLRYDGFRQRQFVVQRPGAVILPTLPQLLEGNRFGLVQLRDPRLRLPRLFDAAAGYEYRLPGNWLASANFRLQDGRGQFRNVSANTPEPGESERPLPPPLENVYVYQANGRFRLYDLQFRASGGKRVALEAVYDLAQARGDTDGPGSFPANRRNLAAEYGRAATDIRQVFYVSGATRLWKRLAVNLTVGARSGVPFNLITGRDVNGDGVFVERPALVASDHPDRTLTPYGFMTPSPVPGAARVPRNLGRGPALFTLNAEAGYGFPVGRGSKALLLEARAWNATNFVNLSTPEGNLASPFFHQSTGLISGYGGIPERAGNRVVEAGLRFVF